MIAQSFQRETGESGELTREADVTQQVGAVGCDFEIEDHIGLNEIFEELTHRKFGVENHQATVVIAEAELLSAAHHAVGCDFTQLAFFDLEVTGQNGAWKCDGHLVSDFVVFGSTNDLAR